MDGRDMFICSYSRHCKNVILVSFSVITQRFAFIEVSRPIHTPPKVFIDLLSPVHSQVLPIDQPSIERRLPSTCFKRLGVSARRHRHRQRLATQPAILGNKNQRGDISKGDPTHLCSSFLFVPADFFHRISSAS